ncbi:hypothetical protein ACG9X4_12635, partial [Acinetobacter calcoaceticus]
PIGCTIDFRCRLLHLEIILLKKPSRIALCNKANLNNTIEKKCMYFIVLKNGNCLILLNILKKQSKKIHISKMLTRSHYFDVV